MNNKKFYVYAFFNKNWDDIPFYVGKGSNDRYKDFRNRSKNIQAILDKYHCYSEILINNLTEKEALTIEKYIKLGFIEVGFPIVDNEREDLKMLQRIGIEKAKLSGKYIGRPEIKEPENWNEIIEKWRKGNITAKQAMEELGLKRNSFYNLVKRNGIKKIEK